MARTATTDQVRELLERGAQLLEVLPQNDFDRERLPGARNVPLTAMTRAAVADLDPGRPVVVYCYDTECDLSARGAALLRAYGFPDVWDYTGSKTAWFAAGLPGEGSLRAADRAGARCHPMPTCAPSALVAQLTEASFDEATGLCAVVDAEDVVVGVLRREVLGAAPSTPVLDVAQTGPVSVRPSISRQELGRSMADKGETAVLVTTLDGRLLGVVTPAELEA